VVDNTMNNNNKQATRQSNLKFLKNNLWKAMSWLGTHTKWDRVKQVNRIQQLLIICLTFIFFAVLPALSGRFGNLFVKLVHVTL